MPNFACLLRDLARHSFGVCWMPLQIFFLCDVWLLLRIFFRDLGCSLKDSWNCRHAPGELHQCPILSHLYYMRTLLGSLEVARYWRMLYFLHCPLSYPWYGSTKNCMEHALIQISSFRVARPMNIQMGPCASKIVRLRRTFEAHFLVFFPTLHVEHLWHECIVCNIIVGYLFACYLAETIPSA